MYRVPEPAPGDAASRPAEPFHATYPDGPRDAEAIFVTSAQGEGVALLDNGDVYLSGEGGGSGTLAHVSCSLPH